MNWLILVLASSISAAIIIYVLWLSRPEKQSHKKLAVILTALAFILPISLNFYLNEQPSKKNFTGRPLSKPILDIKKSIWTGGTSELLPTKTQNMSMSSVTSRLEEKLKKNPEDINGWILLGRSYAALGQSERAIKLFQDKIEIYPNNINLIISYAETLTQLEDGIITAKANKLYLKARHFNTSHPRIEYNLALYDIQNGQNQLAYNRLKALLDSAPKNALWIKKVRETMALAAKEVETIKN